MKMMRDCRWKLFDHVQKKAINAPMRKLRSGKKKGGGGVKGRPKVTLVKVIKDISIKKAIESMTLYGIEWWKTIC